jgi:hypothetical protein
VQLKSCTKIGKNSEKFALIWFNSLPSIAEDILRLHAEEHAMARQRVDARQFENWCIRSPQYYWIILLPK